MALVDEFRTIWERLDECEARMNELQERVARVSKEVEAVSKRVNIMVPLLTPGAERQRRAEIAMDRNTSRGEEPGDRRSKL